MKDHFNKKLYFQNYFDVEKEFEEIPNDDFLQKINSIANFQWWWKKWSIALRKIDSIFAITVDKSQGGEHEGVFVYGGNVLSRLLLVVI